MTLTLTFGLFFFNLKHITLRYVPTQNKNVLTSVLRETALTKIFSSPDGERHKKPHQKTEANEDNSFFSHSLNAAIELTTKVRILDYSAREADSAAG